ncbi:MAG: hypothetical protein M1826_005621 [Phylliscum demangeonii]|nr:MAG: hypothetical protein M1826_005621 [Phylliscum demangeonii]
MQLSWRHLALLGAIAGVVVAVLPLQFTYEAILDHLRQVVVEDRAWWCKFCMNGCLRDARNGITYLHHLSPKTFPLIPADKCPDHCTETIPGILRESLRSWKGKAGILEAARALPSGEQAQAMQALKRAMDTVDAGLDAQKCKKSDASPPRPKPGSPGHNALDKYNDLPKLQLHSPPPRMHEMEPPPEARGPVIGPPSARDSWAKDKPYHTPLKGMSKAAAERRCRYKPFEKSQPAPSPGLQVPGSAPVPEPAAPLLAPNALRMLKVGV